MTEYGVTDDGFVIKDLMTIIAEAASSSKSLFGNNIDVTDSSPLGKIHQTTCAEMSILWEKLNVTYLAAHLDDASGTNLDKVVEPFGTTRKPAVRSTGYVRFEGTPGTTVPGSTIIKTVDDVPIEFKTDTSLVLADIVTNGGFDSDTSDWTAEGGATLESVSKKLNFTSGGTHEVLVGDTLTGDSSGATAVVSAILLSGGTWAGGDAAGTFYFSTQTGEFEAETLNEGANSNVCTVAGDSSIAGKSGNCLQVTQSTPAADSYAQQTIAVTENRFYDLSVFLNEGTAATYTVTVYDNTNGAEIYTESSTDSAGDWSTEVSQHIEIPTGCSSISVRLIGTGTAATTMLFDSCELVRVAPITAVDTGTDGNIAIGTIISLDSPIPGITSVSNPAVTDGGSEKETDVALRIRTKQSTGAGGKATLNDIVAAVLAVDGVSSATIEENDTDVDYSNMLHNPDFDSDISYWYPVDGTISFDASEGIDNEGCIEITGDGSDHPYARQTVYTVPDEDHTLIVYVKADTGVIDYKIRVWDNDAGGLIAAATETGTPANDWSTKYEKTITIPANCYSVEVMIGQDKVSSGAGDHLFFDGLQLNLDPAGLPPNSIRMSVNGGTDNDVAQALLDTVAGGIRAYGDQSGNGEIDNGQAFTRYFMRPSAKDIYVSATITSDDTYAGNEAVQTSIVDYIGGKDIDDVIHVGLGAGSNVIFYEIVSAIMDVTGVTNVADLKLDTSSPPTGTSDIPIASTEVSYTESSYVTIS